MKRRTFINLSAAAGASVSLNLPGLSSQSGKKEFTPYYETLRTHLLNTVEKAKTEFGKDLRIHLPNASTHYLGLWPDDFLYPLIIEPGLYDSKMYTRIARFITDSVVDMEFFPDRIETDGMPVTRPGSLSAPHAHKMPLHLPAAWIRLLDHLESWGAEIPRKGDWAAVFKRSVDSISFSCGLAYVDPQTPHVGFGFHDPEAITGFELMSSIVLHFGLRRAARFFKGQISEAEIAKWNRLATGIPENLYRLYDAEQGAYLAGSKDCRQVNVWGNGLAYWMSGTDVRKSIVEYYRKNSDAIFLKGFTRQIAEPEGWQRHLMGIAPLGSYTNGGFWSVGSGWVLAAIADMDRDFALELTDELVRNIIGTGYKEYISADGKGGGAPGFLASISVPALALKAIIEKRPFSDFF